MAKLLPSDAAEWDWFGVSVDVSGATAVVGAPGNDDCGSGSGSAYVFEKGDSGWTEVAKLLPHDGAEYECFGSSVAVTGTTVVIGAWGSTDHGSIPGSAYVFEKGVSGWTEVAKLLPDNAAPYDHIGCSVAVSGTTALVGAYGYGDTGSAYIFEPIPEPATLGLFGLVGIATAWSARRRRNTR